MSKTPDTLSSRRRGRRLVAVAAAGALVLAAGTALTTHTLTASPVAAPAAVAPTAAMTAAPLSFADVVERVGGAVVNIQTEGGNTPRMTGEQAWPKDWPQGVPEFFRRFFEDGMPGHFGDRGRELPRNHPPVRGAGSGFVIDSAGHIVTNEHVVRGAKRITVTLKDGRALKAALIGADAKIDLALLKIDADGRLPFVAFADDDKLRVGDWVVAVGNPFGLGHSVTAGIVSARGRDIGAGPYDDFLQIDAAINRGNSGGPAFDTRGRVVGVNTAIYSPSGDSVGIGFAIPAGLAKEVIAELKDSGRVERGWLGVHIQRVTPDIAESLGLDKARGAIVAKVMPDGPAAEAGLKDGDVIVEVDGKDVARMRDLPRLIAAIDAGETADLTVWRDGGAQRLAVTIGAMPRETQVAAATPDAAGDGVAGMRLAGLDQQLRRAYGIADDIEGVVVTEVDPRGPAARKGLAEGDVIVAVGGRRVASPDDVTAGVAEAEKAKRGAVLLQVERRDGRRFVALPLRTS